MVVRELQNANELSSILLTDEGIVIEESELQYANADFPISVIEDGIEMEVRELQP